MGLTMPDGIMSRHPATVLCFFDCSTFVLHYVDAIIAARISGKFVRAIKAQGCTVAQVKHVIDGDLPAE
jgi:hypothetical protein